MNITAEKNRRKLEEALLSIMKKKPFDLITVSEICEAASLSRATFYHHYARTDDVLVSAYETAHENAFGRREWTLDYFHSDLFLKDMIRFFDQNTGLIAAISKWNLLPRVAWLPTKMSYDSSSLLSDPYLSKYPQYTTIYLWGNTFDICMAWILGGKKESSEEMLKMMQYMRKLEQR